MKTHPVLCVLLVVHRDDPGELLVTARFGGIPSVVHWYADVAAWSQGWTPDGINALPLWWLDTLEPEAWDRLYRCLGIEDSDRVSRYPGLSQVIEVAEWAVREGKAERMVLLGWDADDRLIEVTP